MKTPIRNLLTVAMFTLGSLSHAQNIGFQHSSNVLVDEVMYSIGGGNAVSMGNASSMRSLGVGVGWNQLAQGMALRQAVTSTDAVSAVDEAENSRGNNGVPWVQC